MKPNFDKYDYKSLKEESELEGIYVYSRPVTDVDWANIYNGVSVAFKPMSGGNECRMLAVAVSYCAPEDEYRKKTGKYQALIKYAHGESIQLPLAQYLADCGPDETAEILLGMFSTI